MNNDSSLREDTLTFEETLSRLEAERRIDPTVIRTADYLVTASLLDEEKDVLQDAKAQLMRENPRELYLAYLRDIIKGAKEADRVNQYKFAKQISDVAIMGLGIWQEDLGLSAAGREAIKITGEPNWTQVKEWIDQSVFGEYFIEEYSVPFDEELWGNEFPLRISACDASQHRFKLRVPFNKTWATPVIVNNSAGTVKQDVEPKWKHIAVPKDTREYEGWVILGPDDYTSMDEGHYEWAAKSSMDVGQLFVEETFIFKHGGIALKPDVHFRDGRIFPQDHLMNCKIENRHGQLTREAVFRMNTAFRTAKELKILYCGIAKQVQLRVYSYLIDWYIKKIMGKANWNPTGQMLSDTELLRNLLYRADFSGKSFRVIYVTCSILRRFETASNLNRRTRKQVRNDLESLSGVYHSRDITAKDIADEALKIGVVMFFAGHARTDELYIPRYEFAVSLIEPLGNVKTLILRILSALRLAAFDVDEDHLWGLEEPILTLVPTPILVAHDLSKKWGEELASSFSQRVTAEFIRRLRGKRGLLG
ncbi:hypothetical protein M1O57_04380 [Dehalococcoidia bacterium]|nr:hypothetical protein [Dehalococcoidia bacterium]MCL0049321.1 hypothetical protein [Dehalococcoidia bacterium]MCL0104807.1 hypothetical protein [Dehalococcoidia bacterium]